MIDIPLVSIIIPVYNVEKYITTAIASIQNQTHKNLEIIIIDDGSKDNSLEICKNLSKLDDRIKLLKNDQNLGLSKSLNKAISQASGIYIARMDGDDISDPNRIEKQITYLQLNPHISVLGTASISINEEGELSPIKPIVYYDSNTLSFSAYFTQPLFHGSILAKSDVMKEFKYDESSKAEDFELWLRMVNRGIKIANLKDELYFYRVNSEGYSNQNEKPQAKGHNDASLKYLESELKVKLKLDEVAIINNRPQENVIFTNLKSGMAILDRFFTNYEDNNLEEIKIYYRRQKIDIYIQALKKTNSLKVKIIGLSKLTYLSLNSEGFIYLKNKFRP